MKKIFILSFCLLTLLLSVNIARALSLRCGSDLVSPGYLKYEVLQICGEPLFKEIVGEVEYFDPDLIYDSYYRRPNSPGSKIIFYIEEWIYDKGGYHILRFEGSKLVKVESIRRK